MDGEAMSPEHLEKLRSAVLGISQKLSGEQQAIILKELHDLYYLLGFYNVSIIPTNYLSNDKTKP